MFLTKDEYECPYCYKMLEDVIEGDKEYKVCTNDDCTGKPLGKFKWSVE